jgi:hypothetical protein
VVMGGLSTVGADTRGDGPWVSDNGLSHGAGREEERNDHEKGRSSNGHDQYRERMSEAKSLQNAKYTSGSLQATSKSHKLLLLRWLQSKYFL